MSIESIIAFIGQEYDAVKNIPGIEDLRKATNEWDAYYVALQAYLANGIGDPPQKPFSDLSALSLQYPKASAYIDAKKYSMSSKPDKAAAGARAMKRIVVGEKPEDVIRDMLDEWKACCRSHG